MMIKRRCQFGLKTLFVATAIVGCMGWYYRLLINQHELERLIVAQLSEFDSHAEWEFSGPNWLEPVGEQWTCFQRVVSLNIQQPVPTDKVKSLTHLNALRELGITLASQEKSQANSALREVAGLNRLEKLNVAGFFSNAAIGHLQSCKKIKSLYIYSVEISDRGIISLTALNNLEELWLGGMDLTLEGLVPLLKLPKLHDLDVRACYIDFSEDEVTFVQQLRPDVQFLY